MLFQVYPGCLAKAVYSIKIYFIKHSLNQKNDWMTALKDNPQTWRPFGSQITTH